MLSEERAYQNLVSQQTHNQVHAYKVEVNLPAPELMRLAISHSVYSNLVGPTLGDQLTCTFA